MSVRNLRAMFETKPKAPQESPPERGRSPGQSSTETESPRRLSKVRTSFVAIEKDGRIGLQRNPSEASSVSGRKLSGDTEAASSIQLDNTATNVSSPSTSRSDFNRGPASAVSIPSPQRDPGHSPAGRDTTSTNSSGPPEPISGGPPDPIPGGSRGIAAPTIGKQAGLAESPQIKQGIGRNWESESPQSSDGKGRDQVGEANEKQAAPGVAQGEAGTAPESVDKGVSGAQIGDTTGRVASGGTAVTKPVNGVDDEIKATKPAAAPVQKAPSTLPVLKSFAPVSQPEPAVSKPAAAPAQKAASTLPVKSHAPVSQPEPAVSKPSERTSRPSTTPTTNKKATGKKPASTSVSPQRFVKPRSKSPTRPAKLPASLTTHTASSGSKSRAVSGPPSAHGNTARPSSRSSATSGTAGKGVRRSSSVAGRQRPSIGPPPKLPNKDQPPPKKESRVDESFLARMTRPTQAYANKVQEKVPTTPPKKTGTATKKPASAKSGTSRKPVSKTTSAATSAAGSPETDRKPEPSATRKTAPVVEQTPIAEEELTLDKEKEVANPETPKTPEREPTIMEEKEEKY